MLKKTLKFIPILLLSFSIFSGIANAGTVNLNGYAWSENIGWLSFNSNNTVTASNPEENDGSSYAVTMSTTTGSNIATLGGNAWSENIGWVSFDRANTGNPPQDDIGTGSGPIAQFNTATGKVEGWARALVGCAGDSTTWDSVNNKCLVTGAGKDNGVRSMTVNTTTTIVDWVVAYDPPLNWYGITSSADGTKLAAAALGNRIYTSTDSGVTWLPRAHSTSWRGITSSADGTKLAAVAFYDRIYTSTDSGVTWIARGPINIYWTAIASSADGTKLAAVAYFNKIYTSTDSGVTWIASNSNALLDWRAITSSADGTKLAALAHTDKIYTSTDSGVTWIARDSAREWTSITSSADGTKLAAVEYGGEIYTSTDSGVTWTARFPSNWYANAFVTSSADGTKLAAVQYGGKVYISIDSGVTWTAHASDLNWGVITSSSDGRKLIAATENYNGKIYKYEEVITTSTASTSNPGWDGWIKLSGTNHSTVTGLTGTATSSQGVSFNKNLGAFSGYAWGSDVVGWLSFDAGLSRVSCGINCGGDPEPLPLLGVCAAYPTNTGVTWSIQSLSGGTTPYTYMWNNILLNNNASYTIAGSAGQNLSGPVVSILSYDEQTLSPTCSGATVLSPSSEVSDGKIWVDNNEALTETKILIGKSAKINWRLPTGGYSCFSTHSGTGELAWWNISTTTNRLDNSPYITDPITDKGIYNLSMSCTKTGAENINLNSVRIIVTEPILREG